jgi:hypothetical protein
VVLGDSRCDGFSILKSPYLLEPDKSLDSVSTANLGRKLTFELAYKLVVDLSVEDKIVLLQTALVQVLFVATAESERGLT